MGAIYVHIPFCIRKCSYCEFISYPDPARQTWAEPYLDAVIRELEMRQAVSWIGPIDTLYIGGGTPTALPARSLTRLVSGLLEHIDPNPCELTVEANPGTVDRDYLSMLTDAGINRLSIGVQSLTDSELSAIGRAHTADQAHAALEAARQAQFENISVDLMFRIPSQTITSFSSTLEEIIQMEPEHVSAYELTLEERTPLWASVQQGDISLPSEDEACDMYEMAVDRLKAKGYRRYEVSNFAKLGRECRHNMAYWANHYYWGLGTGAHSHIPSKRSWNHRSLAEYIRSIRSGDLPEEGNENLSPAQEIVDSVIIGLRTAQGIYLPDLEDRFGEQAPPHIHTELHRFRQLGLVEWHNGRALLTDRGFLVANAIFRCLV